MMQAVRRVLKRAVVVLSIGAVLLGMLTTAVSAGPVEVALEAALHGPEKKRLRIFRHHFNVKPVEISSEGERTTIFGQLSHHLSWRPDDQVYYTIIKENGAIRSITRQIDKGGWWSILAPIISVVGPILGLPIPPEQVAEVGEHVKDILDGSWQSVADFLITQIALRVDCGTEVDVDRMGEDYWSFDLPEADPALCKSACADDVICEAWTYVDPGIQGDQARCWLKHTVPVSAPSTCCVSGVMRMAP
jgi:hypothetical protein